MLLLAVVFGAMIADGYYQAYRAYKDLQGVFPKLERAREALAQGGLPPGDTLAQATEASTLAQSALDHARFTLGFTGSLPYIGRPIEAVRFGAEAAGDEAHAATIVQSLVVNLLGSNPSAGAPVWRNGVIDVKRVEGLAPQIEALLADLRAGDRAIRSIPSVPFFGRVATLKAQASAESGKAIALAERASSAFRVLPSFLGAHGPRTYFLALQNNSDLRGTGGAVLAYAIVRIDRGRITLTGGGGISQIDDHLHGLRVPLPPGIEWYVKTAHVNPRINNGANYSPNFPEVAPTWAAMVRKSTGIRVDGVIALDPFAISYALKGQPPVRVPTFPGPITSKNVVRIAENRQYFLPKQVQDIFPDELVSAAFGVLTHPKDVLAMMRHLGTALAEKRIQLWSSEPQQQALVARLRWGGALSPGDGDYLYLVDNKRIVNKVDYFGHESIRYAVTVKPSGAIDASCQVELASRVPPAQPSTIVGPWTPYGLNLAMMSLYVPKRAQFQAVSPDGPFPRNIQPFQRVAHVRPTGFVQHVEGDQRVFTQTVAASPGRAALLSYRYGIPGVIKDTAAGHVYELVIQHQPTANHADVLVTVRLPAGTVVKSFDPGWKVAGDVATLHVTLLRDLVTRIVF